MRYLVRALAALAFWPLALAAQAPSPDSVPDTVAAAHHVSRDWLRRLPIDDPRHALALLPGVVIRGDALGIATLPRLSIRGSLTAPSEYLDGASIRFQTTQALGLAPQELAGITVMSAVVPVYLPDANGGVVLYETPEGGDRLAGDVRWDSDEPFGDGSTVGYNRIHGTLSGPFPGASNLTFFLSSTLHGQRSSYRGMGAAAQPAFLPGGVDTTVTDGGGANVALPLWVQWSGECDPGGNAGFECQGLRRPLDWSTARRVQGKVSYRYGTGSSLSISGLVGDLQQRFFPGQVAAAPSLYSGGRISSAIGIVNWRHALGEWRGGPLTLTANLSLVRQRGITGLLTAESELATRDPYLGIAFERLDFVGADIMPLPPTDDILRNVRTNSGLRVAYLNRIDLTNGQPYRTNPFGVSSGWPTQGLDGALAATQERRWQARSALAWRPADGPHEVTLGMDAERTDVSRYTSGLLRQSFMDVWVARPARVGVFAGDRFAVGGALLEVGVRYDHFSTDALFPVTPGRIYSHPRYQTQYVNAPTDPAVYAAFLGDTAIWARSAGKGVWSPRAQLTYPVTAATTLRMGYQQSVEPPAWGTYLRGSNGDLDFTNTADVFGRDVEFATASLAELGVRSTLGGRAVLDVAVYRKDLPSYATRVQPFADPLNAGDTMNLNAVTLVRDVHTVGADARLEWRAGTWLLASMTYGIGDARGAIPGPLGPINAKTTTQTIAAVAVLQAPPDWGSGSLLGKLAQDAGAVIMVRGVSGLPYTPLANTGAGIVAPDEVGVLETLNASRLPWSKHVDFRLTKTVRAGGRDWMLYADARNLMNFRNTFALFAETGAVVNDVHRATLLATAYSSLRNEAAANSALGSADEIDLSACATWTGAGPVNCVALRRVEVRFGNGDGTYTAAEQALALNAYYDAFFGPARFYGMGRTLRIGAQLAF